MISKPTVFILGAGASAHLGYPLGLGLRESIIGHLQSSSSRTQQLLDLRFEASLIQSFVSKFRHSGKLSIDNFLQHQAQFQEIGKYAITQALLEYENLDNLFPISADAVKANWYYYLFDQMLTPSFDDFFENKASFITFNYDRSLEGFLFTALKESFELPNEEVARRLSEVNIIHLHGTLGKLRWQDPDGRHYGECDGLDNLRAANRINIVHQGARDPRELSKAQSLLRDAKLIVFLGFGYDKTNLDRLEFRKFSYRQDGIVGTCYGMADEEIRRVEEYFQSRDKRIDLGDPTENVITFLRSRVRLQ